MNLVEDFLSTWKRKKTNLFLLLCWEQFAFCFLGKSLLNPTWVLYSPNRNKLFDKNKNQVAAVQWFCSRTWRLVLLCVLFWVILAWKSQLSVCGHCQHHFLGKFLCNSCSSETSTDKTSNLSPSVVDLDFWVRLDHNEICLLEKHFWEDNHAVKQIPYCRVSTWKMGKSSFQLSISSNSSFSTSRIQATGILEFGTTIFILVVVIRSMVISRTKLFGLLTVTIQFWDALEASQWTLLADWGF